MTKDKFRDFLKFLFEYDFKTDIKSITPRVRITDTLISINFICPNETIEYSDYTHKGFKKEFKSSLISDNFIDNKEIPLEDVLDIARCEVWLNLTDGYDTYTSIHLWDYSEEGYKEVGEAANY